MSGLPLLAEVTDLAGFTGDQIAADDLRARAVLRMASSVVRAYAGRKWENVGDIPEAAQDVTLDVAARVWYNPTGVAQDAVDDANRRFPEQVAAEGFYLTASNKMVLDGLRHKPNGGLWTLGVEKGDGYGLDTIYVPTGPPPSGYPFPWYTADDPLIQP